MVKSILNIIMLVLVLGIAGCTNNLPEAAVQPVANDTFATYNTTVTPATLAPPDSTQLSTYETTQNTPEKIPTAQTDVSNITFSDYSDMDFSLDYPSTWEIEESIADYSPKQVLGGDIFKESFRIVEFVSEDNRTKLVATTYDFIATGYRISTPDIGWCRNSVTARFPDVNGATAVVNYKFFEDDGGNPAVTFDVILPKSSTWYPYSYSEKVVITLHHQYIFDFVAERGDINAYNNVKEVIFSSIIPNDKNPMGGNIMETIVL